MGKEKHIKTNAEPLEKLIKAAGIGTAWMPNFQRGSV